MYRVLSTAPATTPTGEVTRTAEGEIKWHRVTWWKELGTARSLEEAKNKFGGSPVLEPIPDLH